MKDLREVFHTADDDLIFYVAVAEQPEIGRTKRGWFETFQAVCNAHEVEFEHREYPEGYGLRFFEHGVYQVVMVALDDALQREAETYRASVLARHKSAGGQLPPGFDEDHAIKHGAPPGGWTAPSLEDP